MSEGLHQQPHSEEPTAPPPEGGPEYIAHEAIWLPGMEKPVKGVRHAQIIQGFADEQLQQIDTLEGEAAERAYGYFTSKDKYIYGESAVRIAQGDKIIPANEEIKTADKSDFVPTIH